MRRLYVWEKFLGLPESIQEAIDEYIEQHLEEINERLSDRCSLLGYVDKQWHVFL